MKKSFFGAVLLLFVLATPCLAGAQQRDTWYIGFGLGGSIDETVTVDGNDDTFDEFFPAGTETSSKTALNFKVGSTLDEKNLLGLDITALGQSGTHPLLGNLHIQINNYFLMWTHFPKEEGFFTRLGGGLSIFSISGDMVTDDTYGGLGMLVGLGYAFWMGQSFNLTMNLDYSMQSYSDEMGPDSSDFLIYYIGFDWY